MEATRSYSFSIFELIKEGLSLPRRISTPESKISARGYILKGMLNVFKLLETQSSKAILFSLISSINDLSKTEAIPCPILIGEHFIASSKEDANSKPSPACMV